MEFASDIVKKNVIEFSKKLQKFELPTWDSIPNFGLYMEQVLVLVSDYFNFENDVDNTEVKLTASTINNYVRMDIIPKPDKKKYYRIHIAYIIIVMALKKGLSISSIHKILPSILEEEKVKEVYNQIKDIHSKSTKYICKNIKDEYNNSINKDSNVKPIEMVLEASIVGGLIIDITEVLLSDIKTNEEKEEKNKVERKKK